MVRAMGLGAAGFARVPGAGDQGPAAKRLDGQPSVAQQLMNDGVSFTWVAKDGSTMFAHWLQDHYNQGDGIDSGTLGDPSNCASYSSSYNSAIINAHIESYVNANAPTSVSPYMFVAIGDDFTSPKPCLLTYCTNWNKDVFGSSSSYGDVYVLSATFDHYVALVTAFTSNPANGRPLAVKRFEPTPYWTGFYASRPLLKMLQQQAIRKAMAAETLTFLTSTQRAHLPSLSRAWSRLAPSTHHDFITGTSPDQVYSSEQVPYLLEADGVASGVLGQALNTLASSLTTDATNLEQGLVIFNGVGASRRNYPIWIPDNLNTANATSFYDGVEYRTIQRVRGGVLSSGSSISGYTYAVGKLSTQPPTQSQSKLRLRFSANNVMIENTHISVTITEAANWAAPSIIDLTTGQELVQPSQQDPGAFTLEILQDEGNIYRFANEMPNCKMGSTSYTQTTFPLNFSSIEVGSVRITIPTVVQFNVNGKLVSITRKYVLYEHDQMIRVEIEGAAPSGTSVFLRTPITFQQPIISYGTPYHWDNHIPAAYWPGYNFMAVHNFFSLTSLEGLNIAFYSSVLRAWAMDGTTVVTALLRNTPGGICNGYGADGSDSSIHSVSLSFRIPSGLTASPSLTPLEESFHFTTPILINPVWNTGATPSPTFQFMQTSPNAIITTLKPAESDPKKLVARIYSPSASTDNPVSVTITGSIQLGGLRSSVIPITALENPLPRGETSVTISAVHAHGAAITMRAAVVTLLLVPA